MAAITAEKTGATQKVAFRGTYIVLPVAFFLLSIILAACFYPRLSAEVAYHFANGTPDRWLSRGAITAGAIILQFVLALLGLIVVFTSALAGRQLTETPLMRRLLFTIGNIVALPQLILAFATLDIFLYNTYQIHLIPLWVFALVVMAIVGIVLAIIFARAIRQNRGLSGKKLQE